MSKFPASYAAMRRRNIDLGGLKLDVMLLLTLLKLFNKMKPNKAKSALKTGRSIMSPFNYDTKPHVWSG